MKKILFVIFMVSLFAGHYVQAGQLKKPTAKFLKEQAELLLSERVSVPRGAKLQVIAQPLAANQYIPHCESNIKIELASDRAIKRNNTVKISCITPDLSYPWQIYIPVQVRILYPSVIVTTTIAPGELITEDKIKISYIEKNQLKGLQFDKLKDLIGAKARRKIMVGAVVSATTLCFVCNGEQVSIYARSGSFSIKTLGISMQDGNIGDTIQVRNSASNRVIDAVVVSVGEVEVNL